MKRILPLFLVATLILSLVGCTNKEGKEGSTNTQAEGNSNETKKTETSEPPIDFNKEISGEITVSNYDSFFYKEFLEMAARAFEEKYPNTKINIESASAMPVPQVMESADGETAMSVMMIEEDEGARADYINDINTKLMSGEGADILAIDILPYYKYAENGQLENLDGYMENDPDFNIEDYQKNIFEAVRYNDGTYILPMDYSFDYLAYNDSLFDEDTKGKFSQKDSFTLEELIDLAAETFEREKSEELPNIINFPDFYVVETLIKSNYKEFINLEKKEVNFKDGKFVDLLNKVKGYAEKGYIPQEKTMLSEEAITMDSMAVMRQTKTMYNIKNSFNMLMDEVFSEEGDMTFSFNTVGGSLNTDKDVEFGHMEGDNGEFIFDYQQAYGINSSSNNKELAWEFIKFIASTEMQSSLQSSMGSTSVNKKAAAEKARLGVLGQLFAMGNETPPIENEELTTKQQESLDRYLANLKKYSEKINTYVIKDEIINNTINTEVSAFFKGEKTADEVADVLQSKLELYLNE